MSDGGVSSYDCVGYVCMSVDGGILPDYGVGYGCGGVCDAGWVDAGLCFSD